MEVWKKIENSLLKYDYIINNFGVVKRLESQVYINCKRKGKYMTTRKEKIMKVYINKNNKNAYPCVTLQTTNRGRKFNIHRLLAELFIENPENKLQVNHIDGNKNNYSLNNLEWVTPGENEKHAYDNNLKFGQKGIENPMSKLSELDVIEIKTRLNKGERPVNISKDFNTGLMNIYKIRDGIRWKHIKI